mmetsp:Transcript_84491/g.225779  ORF Transcript_84491/g.225779 Transcript_84491/m.225779 type:complete len:485 (-) Transcript_84491:65-1519(-)
MGCTCSVVSQVCLSVAGGAACASALAVRSFARVGSAVSLVGRGRVGSLSSTDQVALGSSLSVRSFCRVGSSISVVGGVQGLSSSTLVALGSALSVRSLVRFGASMSLVSSGSFGMSFSVFGSLHCGSSISVRSAIRLGSSLSVASVAGFGARVALFCSVCFGSALSTRSFARLGSGVAVAARAGLCGLSVLDFLSLGSSLSVRGFTRLGSVLSVGQVVTNTQTLNRRLRAGEACHQTLSTTGMAFVGDGLAVAGCTRLGGGVDVEGHTAVAGSLSVAAAASFRSVETAGIGSFGTMQVAGDATIGGLLRSNGLEVTHDGQRRLAVSARGGSLHGLWLADTPVSTSDRRLKQDVVPLLRTLTSGREQKSDGDDPVSWVLRELRPVSYTFKGEKDTRFGFIADELNRALPQLVRTTQGAYSGVVYQDIIAVLTVTAQAQQSRIETLEATVESLVREVREARDLASRAARDAKLALERASAALQGTV